MLQNFEIAGIICTSLLFGGDVSQNQAQAIALEFRDYAAKAGGTSYVGDPPSLGPLEPDTSPSFGTANWQFWSEEGLISVRRSDGKIRFFSQDVRGGFADEWNQAMELSPAAMLAFAMNYYNHAGNLDLLSIRVTGKDFADQHTANLWTVMCIRKHSAVEYQTEYDITFMMEYASGRLRTMQIPDLPAPPADMSTSLSPNQALAAGAAMLSQRRNIQSFTITQPIRRVIWSPKTDSLTPDLDLRTQQERLLGEEFRGKLVYWGELRTLETSYDHRFWIFVDPRDGHVLGAAALGSLGVGKTVPFSWSKLQGPLTICKTKGKSIRIEHYQMAGAPKPAKLGQKHGIIIFSKEVVVCAQYYPSSGLLEASGKWCRPDSKLKQKLMKLLR